MPFFSASLDRRIVARAISAWYRTHVTIGMLDRQPSADESYIKEYGGKNYVVLQDSAGVVAVYRLTNRSLLKRLRRAPKGLI